MCGGRRYEIGAVFPLVGDQVQRPAGPVGRQSGIKSGGLAQRDADTAERQGQRRIGAAWEAKRGTGRAERGGEAQRAHAVEQRDGRQVERAPQRVGCRDAAGKAPVEVLRCITAEAARQIGHDRIGRCDAVGERHGVNEWL